MKIKLPKRDSGLTVVELLVVISIFLVITGVTVFQYGNFRSSVSLQNLTDDIALAVRKAQSFAIGARSSDIRNATIPSGSINFNKSFGVHFSLSETNSPLEGNTKSFLMFSVPSTSVNKKYDYEGGAPCGDASNDCVELFSISTADYIKYLIVDGEVKNNPNASLDIVFTRPDPRAYFCFRDEPSDSCTVASNVGILITNGMADDKERTKTISIQNTGQISTQ